MTVPKNDTHKDYARYAEHCLNMSGRDNRSGNRGAFQREMANELRLADTQSGALVGSSKCKWDESTPLARRPFDPSQGADVIPTNKRPQRGLAEVLYARNRTGALGGRGNSVT